jgi:transposase
LVLTIEAQPVPMEVVPGPTGRRRWADAKKAAIVAESFEPGVLVAEVAARHGLRPQHLSMWRSQAREGKIVLPGDADLPSFAPIVVDEGPPSGEDKSEDAEPVIIEIEAGGVVLRVPSRIDPQQVAAIVAALRALP